MPRRFGVAGFLGRRSVSYVIESDPLAQQGPVSSGLGVASSGLGVAGFGSGVGSGPGASGLPKAGPRSFLLDRGGLQFAGALVTAAGPLFYYTWDPYASTSLLGMLDAYAGSVASVALGFYVLKRVTAFPTSHAPAAVLPIFGRPSPASERKNRAPPRRR